MDIIENRKYAKKPSKPKKPKREFSFSVSSFDLKHHTMNFNSNMMCKILDEKWTTFKLAEEDEEMYMLFSQEEKTDTNFHISISKPTITRKMHIAKTSLSFEIRKLFKASMYELKFVESKTTIALLVPVE